MVVRRFLPRGADSVVLHPTLWRFATVGFITTAIDFVLFSLLAVGIGMPVIAANTISYSTGVLTSFILNRTWTFGLRVSDRGAARHAFKFGASNLLGLLLSNLIVTLFLLVMPKLFAKGLSVPLVFIWNYASARFWVFR